MGVSLNHFVLHHTLFMVLSILKCKYYNVPSSRAVGDVTLYAILSNFIHNYSLCY